jgi:hypothetical protein
VGTLSPSVTYEDVSDMFVDCSKTMKNQVQQMIKEGLTKSVNNLNISSNSHVIHVNQHASNPSATHVPLENPQYGMLSNYYYRYQGIKQTSDNNVGIFL